MEEIAKLTRLMSTPGLTDLVFIGSGFAQADLGYGLREIESPFTSDRSMAATMVSLALEAGARLDIAKPISDFSLFGARFNAVLAQGVSAQPLLSIRMHPRSQVKLDHLVEVGMISQGQREFLQKQLQARSNILIAGATSSGKTTLLGALLAQLEERVLVLEQTPELVITKPQLAMTERISNQEGIGGIELGDLVVNALRMRPDRIVVGEVRSVEFKVLLQAMNNGHSGSLATLHASDLDQVPQRLQMLGILSGLSVELTNLMVAASVDLVLQLGRVGNERKLIEVGKPRLLGDSLSLDRVLT